MEHKQFISDDLSLSPHSNQCFQAHRYTKKTNQLNIPDTILENCSAELSAESLKMEAQKLMTDSFNSEDKENICYNQQVACNDSLNNSTNIAIDNSYIRQCERKLLETSNVEDERSNEFDNKSLVNSQLLKVSRKYNDTISTPPSILRKEISMLRTEMAEAHEFHDLEIQLLKEEKFINEVDTENNAELLEKYSTLMELYTALKVSYDEYRKAQEKIGREFQSKTADCLESLCSQIEASDGSLNFSSASFVSFNGGIRSSTMMEDVSEVEATVMHEATVLANDPLSITADGGFKTPLQTPLKSAKKLFPQELNSTITPNTEPPLEEEHNIHLLNLETALYDKIKEVKDLEQRLFKVEDMSVVLQNEFERINSVYAMENNTLKENLSAKTEQLNEMTQKLFTEIISLNPSLRESLIDASGKKLLLVFIETIMENCKKIKADDSGETIEHLQNQLEDSRKECEKLENTVLTRDEEIRMLQSHLSNVRQTREDLASAKEALSDVESRLTLEEAEKKAAENRCSELEAVIQKLNEDIKANETIRAQLQSQLSSAEEEKSEMKKESSHLKELYEVLQLQLNETEKILKSNESEMITMKESLATADSTIDQLKSQLQLVEEEKSGLVSVKESLETANSSIEQLKAQLQMVEEEKSGLLSNESEVNSMKERLDIANKTIEQVKSELKMVEEEKYALLSKESEMNSLKESLETANETIEQLKSELKMLEEEKLGLLSKESEMNSLKESLETANETIEQMKSELKMLEEEKLGLLSKESEVNSLKESLEAANETIQQLKSQLQMVEEEKSDLLSKESEMNSLKESLETTNETIEQLKSQLKTVEEEKSHLQKANDNLQDEIREMKNSLDSETEGLKRRILELNTELDSARNYPELEELRSNLQAENKAKEEFIKEVDEYKIAKNAAESEIQDLKQQILDLGKEIERLKKVLEEAEEEQIVRESTIKDSRNEIDVLKKEKEDLIEITERLTEKLENLEKNNRNVMDAIVDVRTQLETIDGGSGDIPSDLPGDRITKLVETILPAETKETNILTEFVGTIIKTCKGVQNELIKNFDSKKSEWETQKHVDIQNLQEQIKSLNDKNNENEVALTRTKLELTQADEKILELKSQLTSTEVEKSEIELRLRKLEENTINLQTEIEAKETIIKGLDELKIVREKIESENGDLKRQILESEEVIVSLKKNLEIAKEEQLAREARVKDSQTEIEQLKKEKESLTDLTEKCEKLEKIETENEGLKQQIVELGEEIERLKKIVEAAEEGKKVTETAVEESRNEADALRKEKEDLIEVTERLTEKLESLEKDNRNVMNAIADVRTHLTVEKLLPDTTESKEPNILTEFVKTIKEVQNELMKTFDSKESEWESQKQNLQEQIKSLNDKNNENEDALTRTKQELTQADETILELKSQLTSTEVEKSEKELRLRKLEENIVNLQAEIETKEAMIKGLDVREKMEIENAGLKRQILNLGEEMERLNKILEAKEAVVTQVEEYKMAKDAAESEVKDLKQQIQDRGEEMETLKKALKAAEEEQMMREAKMKETRDEIDVLKKQKEDLIEVTERLTEKLEGLEKNNQKVMEVIAEIQTHLDAVDGEIDPSELPGDRMTKLVEKLLPETTETKESNILTEFVGTIIKTCKEVQNELVKTFSIQWETQKQSLQEEINSLNHRNTDKEDALTRTKQELTQAEEAILKLKTQLSSAEVEKTEIEVMVQKLQENTANLQAEIDSKEDEIKTMREKIETENGDLKRQILELGLEIERLKKILEEAEEEQIVRESTIKDSRNEIDVLKKEKDDLMEANGRLTEKLESLEKDNRNVMDAIVDVRTQLETIDGGNGDVPSDLPGDRITKLVETILPEETKETNILKEFVGTIIKTCKGVQNELIKNFDRKKSEWETQKHVDIQNLQEQIKSLNDKNNENEDALTRTKLELTQADETILKLKSQLTSTEVEKVEIELRVRKLEENTISLQAEIDTKETIIKGMDELKIVREKIESENGDLKRQILESEEVIVSLKKNLEIAKEEQLAREAKMKNSQTEIEQLKKEKESLTDLTERFENLEKNNKNLMDVLGEVQTHLDMPENTVNKLLSGKLDVRKTFGERIDDLVKTQTEGLKSENRHLKLGNDSLKEKVKQLTQLIREAATEAKEDLSNLSNSINSNSLIMRSKTGRKSDLCARRLDKLEEINHNLTELITRMLTMTDFPDSDKLKLYSVRDFPGVMKKVVAHMTGLAEKAKEVKEENAQLDEECETYAKIIKDLKKEAATVWKTNKEKTEEMEAEIGRLKEEKTGLEKEKVDLLAKISKLDADIQKLKSSKSEGAPHSCACGSDSKKINELKRTILVKEQKLLELQDLEAQTSSYKSQIEYLKNALERERKKIGEEKDKNKKLQNELNEATKNQKTEEKKGDENQVLDELRMRGSLTGGIVQEFVDKEKMRKLSKDIGILKELCRARYAEIKRLEAVNASLRNNTPKNSNQMDSPIRTRGYNTRSKVQPRDLWKSELTGKENSAV